MLESIFLEILNLSYTGSVVILILLLLRPVLKKLPGNVRYLLWFAALFRLCCPFTVESVISLIPVNPKPVTERVLYAAVPQIDTGVPALDNVVNPSLPAPMPGASVNPLQIYAFIGSWIWLIGFAVMLGISLISFAKLYLRLLKHRIWQRDSFFLVRNLETAFVMGIFNPKIYLPDGLEEKEQRYILLHERTHIRRFDPLFKMLAFLIVCVHWFNPLVWLAFFLFGRDMEMSCDEAVIRKLGSEVKKEYASSLLSLSTGHRSFRGMPLAFGEGDAKGRIQNVLHYKKPAFWLAFAGILVALTLMAGFAFDPRRSPYDRSNEEIAEDFAAYWLETPGRFGNALSNGLGKAFLLDVNGDAAPELFFLSDNYPTTTAEIFDISGKEIKELGSFEIGQVFTNDDIMLHIYRNRSGNILIHQSVGSGESVTEEFIGYGKDGLYRLASLYRETDTSGLYAYYTSPENGEQVTWEEYFERRIARTEGFHAECSILLSDKYRFVVWRNGDKAELADYILELLEKGNCSATDVIQMNVGTDEPFWETEAGEEISGHVLFSAEWKETEVRLVMNEGRKLSGNAVGLDGAMLGNAWYYGNYELQLRQNNELVSVLPLDENNGFPEKMLFPDYMNFGLYADYNRDSCTDFAIGYQNGSGWQYTIFTINENDTIMLLSEPLGILDDEHAGDYGPMFDTLGTDIYTRVLNNDGTEYLQQIYRFDDSAGRYALYSMEPEGTQEEPEYDRYEGVVSTVIPTEGGYLLELVPWSEDPSPDYERLTFFVPEGMTVSAYDEQWSMEALAEAENILVMVGTLPGDETLQAEFISMMVG